VYDVIAGYDPADDLTVYSVGRMPKDGYAAAAQATSLKGVTIGVVREYMDKSLFTQADSETIDVVDKAIDDLRKLGATIVDPGPEGALFTKCIDQSLPQNLSAGFVKGVPSLFPDGSDQIAEMEALYVNPGLIPASGPTLRDFKAPGAAT